MPRPIFYASPDIERGLGLERALPDWHLVCMNVSPTVELLRQQGAAVFCLAEHDPQAVHQYNTLALLSHPATQAYINKHGYEVPAQVMVFKTDPALERLAAEKRWRLVNTSSQLNRYFEYKVAQYRHLKEFANDFPPTRVGPLNSLEYDEITDELGTPFVLQYERGHTGSGTLIIADEDDYHELQKQFPKREVRLSQFIDGEPWTINACATRWGVFCGGLSLQLTGVRECTTRPGATVGNDWQAAHKLSEPMRKAIRRLTERVGQVMWDKGFQGLFGLDLIITDHKLYLIEVNARQTASVSMHTRLLFEQSLMPLQYLHILEFLTPEDGHPQALTSERRLDNDDLREYNQEFNEQALVAPAASQLLIRNTFGKPVQVQTELRPGIYTVTNEKVITWLRPAYQLSEIQSTSEFLLWTNSAGRQLDPEQEVARIQAKTTLVGKGNQPTLPALALLNYVKKHVSPSA